MITILGLVLLVANIGFFVAYGLKWGKGGGLEGHAAA